MRIASLLILITLICSGCQFPLVTKRNLSYEGHFDVDGHRYDFKYDYSCHFEDVSWISERGASWHNRAGYGPIKGQLLDGSRYEVRPARPHIGYGGTCEAKSEAVPTRLFIELKNNRVESFDRVSDRSPYHKITALESKFVFNGTESVPYEPQEKWGTNTNTTKQKATRYYTVWITEYTNENWSGPIGLGVREYINTKKIPWIGLAKNFPFSGWSNDDAQFAREYAQALRWPKSQVTLTPNINDKVTWVVDENSSNIIWLAEPLENNSSTNGVGSNFKTWINYKGNQIEVPLKHYYRLLYDEQRDRIIKVRIEHIDLW